MTVDNIFYNICILNNKIKKILSFVFKIEIQGKYEYILVIYKAR